MMVRSTGLKPRKAWYGELPSNWDSIRTKVLFRNARERKLEADEQLSATQRYGVIPQRVFMEQEDTRVMLALSGTENFKHVDKDDFVISLRSFEGGIERCFYSGCVSPAYTVMKATCEIAAGYFQYLLKSREFIREMQLGVYGIRDGKAVNFDDVARIQLPVPPVATQRAIACYLDSETARIDRLIEEKQKLLVKVSEMEAALRFEMATRGLEGSAPLKSSGIEWIGSIPAHWQVKRNMFLFHERREAGVDGLPVLMVSLNTGVSEGEDDDEGTARVRKRMEDKSAYQIVRKGDVAYNMMRAWQGAIGAVSVDGLVSPAYIVLEPVEDLNARYFEMLARTAGYMKDFERYSYGIASFRWRLYWEGFKEIRTLVPPIDEQCRIVEAFENRRQRFNELRAHVAGELETLAELRSATISDAVFGRFNVKS